MEKTYDLAVIKLSTVYITIIFSVSVEVSSSLSLRSCHLLAPTHETSHFNKKVLMISLISICEIEKTF